MNRMTDACESITLPQTSFAGGNDTEIKVGHNEIQIVREMNVNHRVGHFPQGYACHSKEHLVIPTSHSLSAMSTA